MFLALQEYFLGESICFIWSLLSRFVCMINKQQIWLGVNEPKYRTQATDTVNDLTSMTFF